MKKNVSLTGEAIRKVREIAREAMNPLTIKNLLICLGISTSIIFSSAGGLATREMFTNEVEAATQFSDDSSISEYAREAVESLISTGAIKGYSEDNTFRAKGTITRLEFLSMCVNACDPGGTKIAQAVEDAKNDIDPFVNISYYQDCIESDGVGNLWGGTGTDLVIGAEYLGVACYLEDDGSGKNVWLQPIRRDEAADLMADCLSKLKGEELPTNLNDYNVSATVGDWFYSEEDEASDEAKGLTYQCTSLSRFSPSVLQLYILGILHGDSEAKFHPQYNLTREDSAVMIYALINESKRDTSKVVLAEKVDPYAGVEVGTLYETDQDRRDAVPGDTFIDSNGTSYTVEEGVGGILGEGQPIALDAGRLQEYNDSNPDNDRLVADGVSSDGTYYRLGATYYINPATGEGHWSDEWDDIQDAYKPTDSGSYDGEIRTFGLGGWCKYEWIEAAQAWSLWDYNHFD